MKTKKLQQEFIKDQYEDIVKLASEIIGVACCDTMLMGNPEKNDNSPKYQILPDPYSTNDSEMQIDLRGFENYFYKNFGKWKDHCYFDTPIEAFFALLKAWIIWNKHLTKDEKHKYLAILA